MFLFKHFDDECLSQKMNRKNSNMVKMKQPSTLNDQNLSNFPALSSKEIINL